MKPPSEQELQGLYVQVRQRKESVARLHERMLGLDGLPPDHPAHALLSDSSSALTTLVQELDTVGEQLRVQNETLRTLNDQILSERERYRDIFERAPVAYVVTDYSGQIREGNAAAEQLFHADRKQLCSRAITSFVATHERAAFRTRLNAVARGRELNEWRWTVCALDGLECDIVADIARLVHGENRDRLFWILRMVSRAERQVRALENSNAQLEQELARRLAGAGAAQEALTAALQRERAARVEAEEARRLAEQAREQLERAHQEAVAARSAYAQFLGMISHEIRTPMQAIVGYTEFLTSGIHGPLNDAQQKDANRIIDNLGHVLWLMNNVLEFARLGHMGVELHIVRVPLLEALRAVRGTILPLTRTRGVRLEVEELPVDVVVRADAERLHQILINLVSNAVKFTPPGGRVTIACTASPEDVRVLVSDTGPGIAAADSDRIFEPFVRIGTGADAPGAGLGLPISRELARRMGGDVTCLREVPQGAAFLLRLPRA